MFKKREVKGKGIRRKREEDTSENIERGIVSKAEEEDNTTVVRDGIGNSRKRVNAFSTGGGGYNQQKKNEGTKNLGALLAVESLGSTKVEFGGSATATNDIDTAHDHDARAIAEKNLMLQKDGGDINGEGAKIYRGQAGYKNFIAKDESQIGNNKNTGTQGPIRAPAFFRTTCRFDYQPDICKDYKDTGYCGFGDSCKFMHDRGNYKSGYQMEKEWDEKQAERKRLISMGIDPDEDGKTEDSEFEVKAGPDLPFACYLCRGPFVDPIQTTCSHYFCQNCAVKQFRNKGPNCPICNKNTAGIFNNARKLIAHANSKGGFEKLFLTESGEADQDKEGDQDGTNSKTQEVQETSGVPRSSAGGSWAVVDIEEENTGVGDLLLASEEKPSEDYEEEKKTEASKQDTSALDGGQTTAEDDSLKQSKLMEVAASLGWALVNAHGQTYWFNQAMNMTSREVPASVTELLEK